MDYNSDFSKRRLVVLSQAVSTVDLKKTAAAVDSEPAEELPACAYANPIDLEYPVHTKEAALLSASYFFGDHPDDTGPEDVRKSLEKAAEFWDVKEEFDGIKHDLSAIRAQPKYALDMTVGGAVLRHFPWHDKESLEKTAQDFYNNRNNLPYEARCKTAENLLAAQKEVKAQFNSDLVEYIDRCCGYGTIDFDKVGESLLERSHLLRKQAEHQGAIKKLAHIVQELKCLTEGATTKTAVCALAAFDEETGLARRYGKGLELPEDEIVGITVTKHAADSEGLVQLQNGNKVRLTDIDWSKVAEIDPDLADAVNGDLDKAAEVLPTWPRPDADALVAMLGLQTV